MDTNPLRSWLGLPAGPWPPDHATLLGLEPGIDPATAERRALELMGRLRSHQLVHPELVTEGMNRLAQALLGLSSQFSSPPPPAVSAFDLRPTATPSPQILDAEPVVFDAEPVEAELAPVEALQKPAEVVWKAREIAAPLPEVPTAPEPAIAERRAAYRELAGLRTLAEAWDSLRTTVAVPSERFATADAVFVFLEGLVAFRAASNHAGLPVQLSRELSPLLTAVLNQQLPLTVLRDLRKKQRRNLARDWAVGRANLQARRVALRKALNRTAPRRKSGGRLKAIRRALARHPEWLLAAATVGVVLIATVKVLLRS